MPVELLPRKIIFKMTKLQNGFSRVLSDNDNGGELWCRSYFAMHTAAQAPGLLGPPGRVCPSHLIPRPGLEPPGTSPGGEA